MQSFEPGGLAVIVGASGGIGAAMKQALEMSGAFVRVHGSARADGSGEELPRLDLTDEHTIAAAADHVKATGLEMRVLFDATGLLHGDGVGPEKSLGALDPAHMAQAFAINAIGPALLMKHFLPLMPKAGKSVFATLSAKVGSIGDNQLGGWYSYRASKAALNQLVRTAAIELARKAPEAICVALHPGTVETGLSDGFAKNGLNVRRPEQAAAELTTVIDQLDLRHSGGFFDYKGAPLPW